MKNQELIRETVINLQKIMVDTPRLSNADVSKIAQCIRVLQKHNQGELAIPRGWLTLPEISRLYNARLGDMSLALNMLNTNEPAKYKRVKIPKLGHFSYVYSPETINAVKPYIDDMKWTPDK